MKWLFKQLDGPVQVDTRDRDDVIVVEVPQDTVGYITGARRAALSGRLEGIQILKNNLRFPDRHRTQQLPSPIRFCR